MCLSWRRAGSHGWPRSGTQFRLPEGPWVVPTPNYTGAQARNPPLSQLRSRRPSLRRSRPHLHPTPRWSPHQNPPPSPPARVNSGALRHSSLCRNRHRPSTRPAPRPTLEPTPVPTPEPTPSPTLGPTKANQQLKYWVDVGYPWLLVWSS